MAATTRKASSSRLIASLSVATALPFCMGGVALAQDKPPPADGLAPGSHAAQPASPEPSEARLKLARRVLDDMGTTANLASGIKTVVAAWADSFAGSERLPPETMKALNDSMSESMTALAPKIIEQVARVYAQQLDEHQLEDIAAFYEGPTGKAWVAKLPALAEQSGAIGAALVPELQADVLDRFCRKVSCTPDQKKRFLPQQG